MTPAHHDTNGAEEAYELYRHELTDPGHDPDEPDCSSLHRGVAVVFGGIALAILLIGLVK